MPLALGVPALLTYLYRPHVSSVLWAAVTVFSVFFISLFTSITLYRVSPWHPLAKYPGPLICKLTQFHLATLSLRGKQHIYFAKMHEKYGDIVRVGKFYLLRIRVSPLNLNFRPQRSLCLRCQCGGADVR